jgi:hypothetical protein
LVVSNDANLAGLRDEIRELLSAALERNGQHIDEIERRDELHIAETERRDELHVQEMHRRDDLHAHELELIHEALETRDIIGQAKGVIMAALSCPPDEAFNLLRQQSQHENRKLVVVATEVASRAWKRPGTPNASPPACDTPDF